MQIYQTKKEKILKIIQIIYDIISALFIVFVSVSLIIGSNKGDKGSSEHLTPTIQQVQRKELVIGKNDYNYSLIYKVNVPTSWNGTRINNDNSYVRFTAHSATWTANDEAYAIYASINGSTIIYNDEPLKEVYDRLMVSIQWDNTLSKATLTNIYLENDSNSIRIYPSTSNIVVLCDNIDYGSSQIYSYGGNFNYEEFFGQFFDFYSCEGDSLHLDSQTMNPITYYSYEIMGDNTAHNTGSYTGHIDLDMIFISCGKVYKGIRFDYNYVLGTYYNDTLTTYDNMTYLALISISYKDYNSDEWVKVCVPRIYKFETRTLNNVNQLAGYPFTAFNTYIWSNEGYKDIFIISGGQNVYTTSSADPIANLTNIQVLTYKGEYNNNVYLVGDNGTNVFNLLSSGFSAVLPIFSIVLLPGLTIGTLLFLPLVITIIFAIIKLLRK